MRISGCVCRRSPRKALITAFQTTGAPRASDSQGHTLCISVPPGITAPSLPTMNDEPSSGGAQPGIPGFPAPSLPSLLTPPLCEQKEEWPPSHGVHTQGQPLYRVLSGVLSGVSER